jgi:pimeloyl-ACP methyl ester carboxylesterase
MISTLLLSLSLTSQFIQTDVRSLYATLPTISQAGEPLPRRGALGLPLSPVPADQREKLRLKPTEGLVAGTPLPGLTADRAGIKPGDIIVSINEKQVGPGLISNVVREIATGAPMKIKVLREGKPLELSAAMVEKPRDPGNENFEVTYTHVVSNGHRMRTIISKPKKAGKHPALMFIQGFSPVSYDFTLATSTGDVSSLDGPILYDFANSGFVTLRIEKPGVGDSEGGPFPGMDYTTELDIYRQALKQLKAHEAVDADNVFIFGHSMGGAFGPMIAAENPVKGLAIYGAAARTWFEYLMDTIRYQGLVGGGTFENADEIARLGAQLMALVFLENKAPAEVKVSHPKLAGLVDEFFPGGLFNGKSLDFWRQLAQTNFASYWAKCNAHVLAVKGQADFVVYEADHKLIADIVNRAKPGYGKFLIAPNSDHLFHDFPSEQESMKNFQRGKFNPAFTKIMKDWIKEVMSSKD